MAKLITTTEISYSIEAIIKNAKCYILLVTPFLRIHKRLKDVIEEKLQETGVILIIICKEKELRKDETAWLKSNKRMLVFNCDNLHGKCYLNEDLAVITSMNLYEFSLVNNIEFGVLLDYDTDKENYNVILKECLRILSKASPQLVKEILKFGPVERLKLDEELMKDFKLGGKDIADLVG